MSELEREEFIKVIEKYTKRFKTNKSESKKFLLDAGIITKKGNLKKAYRPA